MSGRRLTSSWTRSAPRPVSGAACGGRAAGCPDGPLHPTPEKNAMTLIDRLGAALPRAPVTVDLDDIQAAVLRYRPEPYYGTHVMLHVADAQAGRAFLRRLAPHVDSAADWWQAGQPWISVALSYAGLVALGVPQDSLRSFPEAFRAGMAARAGQLLDDGTTPRSTGTRRSGAGSSTSGS